MAEDERNQMKIGVVIPFYQRESGILTRALTSIRNQHLPFDVQLEVIVVDDQSPVPAAVEMASFRNSGKIRWNFISQKNAGPGSARNSGIDWLAEKDVQYIAFLDSDDEWRFDHLLNATSALESGGDFYFSDHCRTEQYCSYFKKDENVSATFERIKDAGAEIVNDGARMFAPGEMNHAIIENYLAQTSTVVLRRKILDQVRFDPDLRHSGEDYMLWVQLALKGARICISDEIEVVCGTGINMYHGSSEWDSENILALLSSQIIFYGKLIRLPLGPARLKMKRKLQEFRRLYAYLLLRRLAQRRLPAQTGLTRVLRRDPLLGLEAPLLIVRFLLVDRRRIARQ